MIRRRVIVSGRVQGVFFRDTLRRRAGALGVSGWARNNDDGTVEAVFEGELDSVEQMIELSRTGSERAEVENVQLFEEEPEGRSGFDVS